jgi:hypothetical protein
VTKRPSRKFVGCKITRIAARGALARRLLDTGFGTTGVWQQERRSAATAQIGRHGQIRTADHAGSPRGIPRPAGCFGCLHSRNGLSDFRSSLTAWLRSKRSRSRCCIDYVSLKILTEQRPSEAVRQSVGRRKRPHHISTATWDTRIRLSIRRSQRADSRLIITTSRYSPGTTSVASPERLRPFTRAIKSSCNADCLVASRAAKALRMGP